MIIATIDSKQSERLDAFSPSCKETDSAAGKEIPLMLNLIISPSLPMATASLQQPKSATGFWLPISRQRNQRKQKKVHSWSPLDDHSPLLNRQISSLQQTTATKSTTNQDSHLSRKCLNTLSRSTTSWTSCSDLLIALRVAQQSQNYSLLAWYCEHSSTLTSLRKSVTSNSIIKTQKRALKLHLKQ